MGSLRSEWNLPEATSFSFNRMTFRRDEVQMRLSESNDPRSAWAVSTLTVAVNALGLPQLTWRMPWP